MYRCSQQPQNNSHCDESRKFCQGRIKTLKHNTSCRNALVHTYILLRSDKQEIKFGHKGISWRIIY